VVLHGISPGWRNAILAVLGALLLWFLWTVRAALNPLGVGLLFAYMLHPMVTSLERHGWSRRLAVNVIFAATAIGVAVLGAALILQARGLWTEMAKPEGALARIETELVQSVTWFYEQLDRWGIETPEVAPGEEGEAAGIRLQDVFAALQEWLAQEGYLAGAGQAGLRAAGGVWSLLRRVFGSLLTLGGYLLLVPIYTWFLLFELERISDFVESYIPRPERARFGRIGNQIAEMLGNFFRGRMLVCLLKGLVLAIALRLAGFPYALLIGVVSGFLSLVPFIGPAFGYGLAFLLGLLEFDLASCAVRMAVVYAVGELVEGYILLPRVLGDSIGLHPIVVIASLMVFGAAFGLFGMLLALPLTSAAVIVARELVLPALRDLAEGRAEPEREPPTQPVPGGPGAR
jgi:predicted PurR-regulated permease PerM